MPHPGSNPGPGDLGGKEMGRSGYSDDCDSPGLWRGVVCSATRGKRGQAFLRELAEQMDAMPEKRLIKSELVDAQGECCIIGVVCKARNLDVTKIDIDCPTDVGDAVGISHALAAEIENENDEGGPYGRKETPEERWLRMRKWVAEQISRETATAAESRGSR